MGYHILLVDDDRNIRELFKTCLAEYYEITAVGSGPEALDLLRKPNEIDVVVLDVMLPGMRGTEVLKEVKKIDPKIGIIMSTAYSSKDVAVAALKGHADDYVEKPLNIAKIKESIERLLQIREGRDDLSACDIASKVDKVKRFTERNCDKKVSLKDAASAVCLSPKYLSRIFKERMGISFCHYKSELKIQKARELLAQTGYNISQISDKLGYQNVESFIRTFRKFAHCTPSDYRHKHLPAFQAQRSADPIDARDKNGRVEMG